MRRLIPSLLFALSIAGCTTAPVAPPATIVREAPPVLPPVAGLDRVIGHGADDIIELFGPPDQDMRGPGARRLQFSSVICVLDVYLYPKDGSGPAVATYLDARLTGGEDFDRASCIAALARRPAAR